MISEVERMQAEAALNDIAVRRAAVYQQYRGSIDPPPEFYGQLRALDTEARYWQGRLSETPTPVALPAWGERLWGQMIDLQNDFSVFKDERRRDRLEDMTERDRARQQQQVAFVFVAATMVSFLVVLVALGMELWR